MLMSREENFRLTEKNLAINWDAKNVVEEHCENVEDDAVKRTSRPLGPIESVESLCQRERGEMS